MAIPISNSRIIFRLAAEFRRSCLLTIAVLLAVGTLPLAPSVSRAQQYAPRLFEIGAATVQDIWVDRANGNDSNSGDSRANALRTVTAAWNRIPEGTRLTGTGYRIQLTAATYPPEEYPVYWESRLGSFQCPVILNSVDGPGLARFSNVNFFGCDNLYVIGLLMTSGGGDVAHFAECDVLLLRDCTILGTGDIPTFDVPQESLKINQATSVYVEGCDISGAWDNAVDCVAVQYGAFVGNRIHRSGDWCMYLKGGSAQIRVEANEFYDGGTGGFTAGQGTGFEFMTDPFLHFEAYDIRFFSNLVHDTEGAGIGVNGGYNVLVAYNTLYRVGSRSHALEFGFGLRGCDGDADRCRDYLARGGWGTAERNDGTNEQPIPNRNVYVYGNVLYNPAGFRSEYSHFSIQGPRNPAAFSNIPSPARADDNLRIRGNVIWNGPADLPLGIEDSTAGCQASNPSCFAEQLRADNSINTVEPQLVAPAAGDFRPVVGGNLFAVPVFELPDFAGGDLPASPATPAGNLTNDAPRDFTGAARTAIAPPGAFAGSGNGPSTFALSGRVTGPDGSARPGIRMTFTAVTGSGSVPATVTTDGGGSWSQTGFADGTVYRITPSDTAGSTFEPASRDASAAGSGIDFRASGGPAETYTVSGAVRKRSRVFANVELRFSVVAGPGTAPPAVLTGADGRWSQSGFAAGTTYRVTPVLDGYRFKPASREVSGASTGVNFKPKRT